MLWYQRLAHPGAHVVTVLQRRGLVPPSANRGPSHVGGCQSCALEKGKRRSRQSRDPTLHVHPQVLLCTPTSAFHVACILIVF
jgi:hypothetical protein